MGVQNLDQEKFLFFFEKSLTDEHLVLIFFWCIFVSPLHVTSLFYPGIPVIP